MSYRAQVAFRLRSRAGSDVAGALRAEEDGVGEGEGLRSVGADAAGGGRRALWVVGGEANAGIEVAEQRLSEIEAWRLFPMWRVRREDSQLQKLEEEKQQSLWFLLFSKLQAWGMCAVT